MLGVRVVGSVRDPSSKIITLIALVSFLALPSCQWQKLPDGVTGSHETRWMAAVLFAMKMDN